MMRSLWLCNSGVGMSETFLEASVNLISDMSEATVVCGSPALGEINPRVHYGHFANRPQRLHHTLVRKLTGVDVRLGAQRRQCEKEVLAALHGQDLDFIWIEFATTAWLATKLLDKLDVPYFINVHGYDISRAFASNAYRQGFVELANQSAGVVCSSHHTRMLCQIAGVEKSRLHVVRLGIDSAQFPDLEQKTSYPSFVHFGRLTGKKGPLISLEAFAIVHAKHPDARMTFVGSGPLKDELEQRIMGLRLMRAVSVIDGMPWFEGLKEVSAHWVFCQHSITHIDGDQEGFALSPAEAAIMGMPVVSTYHNGIPEHVMDGVSGFLVREHDLEAMADRMIRLIENPEMRVEMGAKGRDNILTMCDPAKRKRIIKEVIDIKLKGNV